MLLNNYQLSRQWILEIKVLNAFEIKSSRVLLKSWKSSILICLFLFLGELVQVVSAWPSRARLRLRCPVRIIKMAVVVWSTFPSLMESMTLTSHSEAFQSQVGYSTFPNRICNRNQSQSILLLLNLLLID